MLFRKMPAQPANEENAQRCVETLYRLRGQSEAAFQLTERTDEAPRTLKRELKQFKAKGARLPGNAVGESPWEALAMQLALAEDPECDRAELAQTLRMCTSLHGLYGAATFQLARRKTLELPDPRAPRLPFDETVFDQQRTWDAQRCENLLARIDVSHARTALELGCGAGASTLLLLMENPGLRVIAVDFSEKLLEEARRNLAGYDVEFLLCNLGNMEANRSWADNGPFDLVFSNAALNFAPNERALAPLIWQACAPGGTVAIQQEAHTAFADLHHFLQLAIKDLKLQDCFTPGGAAEPLYPDSHLARMLIRNALRNEGFTNVTATKVLDDPLPENELLARFYEDHLPYYLQKLYDLDDYDDVRERLLAEFDNNREVAGKYRKSPGALYLTAEKPQ